MAFIPDSISNQPVSGFVPDPIATKQQPNLVQSIAKPFLKTVASAAEITNRGAALFGYKPSQVEADRIKKEGLDFGPLGTQRPIGADFDIRKNAAENVKPLLDAVGTGAEVASYLVPGSAGYIKGGAIGGATLGFGSSLQDENPSLGNTIIQTLAGGLTGTTAGGSFKLLGKGLTQIAEKFGSQALSFTSGVPAKAITEASRNPGIAKEGLKLPVSEVRNRAAGSLNMLRTDLSNEFASGLDTITNATGQTKSGMTYNQQGFLKSAPKIQENLTEYGRRFAREFRLSTQMTPDGVVIGFDKSPIVKPGEMGNVQRAFTTISTWNDFSAKGMQDLAERIGALRNFESGAKTESSAILSKLYNKIAGTGETKGLIPTYYPELATLRTNFAQNRKVLDEIGNVLNSTSKKPTSIQGAVSRLDNLFKENRDVYMNVIKQLSDRSGIDYTALLAGGEFQKILPGFVRGIGGGSAVAVGGAVLNPYLLLLAPLFSPRFAGTIARNAPRISRASSAVVKSVVTPNIPRVLRSSLPQGGQQ